ncbi:hypothetical protein JCM19239_2638 [Vibrio variabilis]|uniref:Uncharacterized protein n=1 Tax=Vibrio variabilis TaxID=990271 RepID=A0ABQ0JPG5_9VIBR|nr:hypothetical protein JCM19239_2638 [Vibrio variabilis]
MVHLHARKRTGQHSLEIEDNLPLYEALKDKLGDSILVQLTTELSVNTVLRSSKR